jgi:hypothetical protein
MKDDACSFCFSSNAVVAKSELCAARICAACVSLAVELSQDELDRAPSALTLAEIAVREIPPRSPVTGDMARFRCSFCDTARRDCLKMISGPNHIHICNVCAVRASLR